MKIKKTHLYTIAGVLTVIIILFVLKDANKPFYQNVDSPRPILGNLDADIKVIEFSDFQCPACRSASSYPARLVNEFGSDISFELKHFPLSNHQYAFDAALAAECANDQGRFWEYDNMLFVNQQDLKKKDLKNYAKSLGLDTASFNACLDSEAKREIVEQHLRDGYAANIPGTPTFIVNGKRVESTSYDEIKKEIESLLLTS